MTGLSSGQWAIVYNACPPLKRYSKATLIQAARELDTLPRPSAARGLVIDYGKLRDACRYIDDTKGLPVESVVDLLAQAASPEAYSLSPADKPFGPLY